MRSTWRSRRDQPLRNLSERNLKAARHISLILGFRPRQQFGYIGLQLRLDLAGMCRLALAWIVVPSSPI